MAAARAESLTKDYEGNTWLIQRLCEGLSHAESLIQPDFEANCFNWVLGHIVWRRNVVLAVLGGTSLWPDGIDERYRTGSPPLVPGDEARDLALLLDDLAASTAQIAHLLGEATEAFLDEVVATDRGENSRRQHLANFHWHETFHVGQLDLLRALALSRRA